MALQNGVKPSSGVKTNGFAPNSPNNGTNGGPPTPAIPAVVINTTEANRDVESEKDTPPSPQRKRISFSGKISYILYTSRCVEIRILCRLYSV